MPITGSTLVNGGEKGLETRMKDWGYLDKTQDLGAAVQLWQSTYKDAMDPESHRLHRRELDADGDIGPVSAAEINNRFCNVSDFASEGIQEANWPDACRNEITISWNFSKLPGLDEAKTTAAWEHLIKHPKMFNQLFHLTLVLKRGDYPQTRIFAALKALPGPTLAWSFLANGDCRFRAEQAYDSTVNWSSGVLAPGTIGHEVGHALGLEHTPNDRNSLMYPSMNGQWYLNDTDIAQLIRRGYKKREKPPDPSPGPVQPDKVTATIRIGSRLVELFEKNGGDSDGDGGWWP